MSASALKVGRTLGMVNAVAGAMEVVRKFQQGLVDVPEADVKANNTLVTVVDRQSGEAMKAVLTTLFPGVPLNIEDVQGVSRKNDLVLLVDPLDGTGAFAGGLSTSTVIAALYSWRTRSVEVCVIGEPSTGRVWYAEGREPTMRMLENGAGDLCAVKVSDVQQLDSKSIVLVDVSYGFQSRGREVLTNEQTAELLRQLGSKSNFLLPGSNGFNQAMVANGGQRIAGSITLAIGGPYDVAGAKLVLNAGGYAIGYSVANGKLKAVDPLDVLHYDLLITAASNGVLGELVELVNSVHP